MANETDWKKVLEDNRAAIEQKMVELYREWEGNNQDVHECLGITQQGELFTWEYVGNFSEPESVWNGTDFHITTFNAWNWDDGGVDWESCIYCHARTQEEKEAIRKRFDEAEQEGIWGENEYQILLEEFPEVFQSIKEAALDHETETYISEVEDLLNEIISQA